MSDVFTLRGPVKKDRPALVERSITRRSLSGAELGSVALEPMFFGITPHMAVLHQVIKAQLAAKRSGTQSTKTRKESVAAVANRSIKRAPVALARARSGRRTIRVGASRSDPGRAVMSKRPEEDDSLGAVFGVVGPCRARARGAGGQL